MTNSDKGELVRRVMAFCDDFVQEYYVVESPILRKPPNFSMGYRPESKYQEEKEKENVNFSFVTRHPSRKEIENRVKLWVQKVDIS